MIWDSEKKEYIGIMTIRDLLEMIVFVCDSLKDAFKYENEIATMKEKDFICHFMQKYFSINNPLYSGDQKPHQIKKLNSLKNSNLHSDFSIIPKIM